MAVLLTAAAFWPSLARGAYYELLPGGMVAAGTTYNDPRLLWSGGLRLVFGILALFTIVKAVSGYFGTRTHAGSQDAMDIAFADLKDSATILVLTMVGAAVAPWAVDVAFRMLEGAAISFG